MLTVAQTKKKKTRLLMCVGAISLFFFGIPSFVNSFYRAIVVLTALLHALLS